MPTMRSKLARLALACALAAAGLAEVSAQSWPQMSWWSIEPARVNPAAPAQSFTLAGTGYLRRQWLNLPGSPTTVGATVSAPVYRIRGGAAFSVERDQIGSFAVTQLRASGSYSVLRKRNYDVSIGVGGNYRDISLDGEALRTDDGTYAGGQVNHRDPILPQGTVTASTLGVDLGASLQFGETQVGASVLDVNAPVGSFAGFGMQWPRQFTAYAKTTLPVAERLDLQVGGLLYSDRRLTQIQVHAFGWYGGNIGAGVAFRGFGANMRDAITLLLSWRASETLTFAYAYDAGLSALKSAHEGSHEIVVRYALPSAIGRGRLPPVIYSPRL